MLKVIMVCIIFVALCCCGSNQQVPEKNSSQQISSKDSISQEQKEIVIFNIKTFKYHCPSCRSAIKCTENCITVSKNEAVVRGGIPCKICNGTCY